MDPVDLALVAYKLALLTFYTGVLLYALPIPLARLKRWAPELIADSFSSLLLALLYLSLLGLTATIYENLGGSWVHFNSWYTQSLSAVVSLKLLLGVARVIPDLAMLVKLAYSIISPLDRAASLALLFLVTIGGIAFIVVKYGAYLLALGVALYSVPFRITRGAGAWLVAFILVFNTGLPLLPLFLNSISTPPVEESEIPGFTMATVKVVDAGGRGSYKGVLEFRSLEGDTLARYPLDSKGVAVSELSPTGRVALPDEGMVRGLLEYNGVRLPLKPNPIVLDGIADGDTLLLTAENAVFILEPMILGFTNSVAEAEFNNGSMEVTARLESAM